MCTIAKLRPCAARAPSRAAPAIPRRVARLLERLLVLAAAKGEPRACFELFKFVVVHSGRPEYLTTARTAPRQAGHRDKAVRFRVVQLAGRIMNQMAEECDVSDDLFE